MQTMNTAELGVPNHFDESTVGQVWRVPYADRAREAERWARTHDIRPAASDEFRIGLLLIDCQNTFCIPGFEMFVGGDTGDAAVRDNTRLCRFIYRNLHRLTRIVPTLDTHEAQQIFHPVFWIDERGNHPEGGRTVIRLEDLEKGTWRVNPGVEGGVWDGDEKALNRYAHHYVSQLTEGGKFPLLVWPYHGMLGGIGHALVPAVEEAIFFHGMARQCRTRYEMKGRHPLTEHYSALHPEVRNDHRGRRLAGENEDFIRLLLDFDRLIIAGQAQSHCVAWTVDDLLNEIRARQPDHAGRVYLLEDATSPVVVPDGPDFTDQAREAFRRFAAAGMHPVSTTTPMNEWPDFTA